MSFQRLTVPLVEAVEISTPCVGVSAFPDQRSLVEDLEAMIGAHECAEAIEISTIDAVDEAHGKCNRGRE
jgi:hypothetical protein